MHSAPIAIVYLFADGGLRLPEVAGLTVDDVDVRERMVFVSGRAPTGWGRSQQMLDRYGRTNATGRAKEAYRRLSFRDRL